MAIRWGKAEYEEVEEELHAATMEERKQGRRRERDEEGWRREK